MELALVGFPGAGKSTLFRVVTEAAGVATGGSRWGKAQVGVVKVPDPRLTTLAGLFPGCPVVTAEIRLVDFPPPGEGAAKGAGITGELLSMLQRADALVHVVRAFDDTASEKARAPLQAVEEMDAEMVFADLAILERRVKRVDDALKGAKPGERAKLLQEKAFFERVKDDLERAVPVRRQTLSDEERQTLRDFQFLTAKPVLVVFNVDDKRLGGDGLLGPAGLAQHERERAVVICAKLEEELLAMAPEERTEFRASLGVPENARDLVMTAAYDMLDLVTFFTAGEDETRAWPVERGTPAVKAAGKVHSDIQRGFIRAEVVALKDLLACGGFGEVRKRGLLRLEGKGYTVQDADVINYLFNV
ncbi:MAG: redox-regulated ATPase YchF [Dehalococcoidia bacterium]|nr:redox-regulated ATPase YchF [Dehalococcoidia bacterium]